MHLPPKPNSSPPKLPLSFPPQLEKYQNHHFGRCPRVYCNGQAVLPVGLSDSPRNYTVNVFCPKCHEIFHPRSAKQGNLDGAYFGSTFAHLFLLSHPDLIPPKTQQTYVPRIYGFRINKDAAYYKQRCETPPNPACILRLLSLTFAPPPPSFVSFPLAAMSAATARAPSQSRPVFQKPRS